MSVEYHLGGDTLDPIKSVEHRTWCWQPIELCSCPEPSIHVIADHGDIDRFYLIIYDYEYDSNNYFKIFQLNYNT